MFILCKETRHSSETVTTAFSWLSDQFLKTEIFWLTPLKGRLWLFSVWKAEKLRDGEPAATATTNGAGGDSQGIVTCKHTPHPSPGVHAGLALCLGCPPAGEVATSDSHPCDNTSTQTQRHVSHIHTPQPSKIKWKVSQIGESLCKGPGAGARGDTHR